MRRQIPAILLLILFAASGLLAQEPPDFETIAASDIKGKRPLILIPGIMGSELINKYSGEKVWFNVRRSKDDDLTLPIAPSLARSRDNLVPGKLIRSVKFLFKSEDYYGDFIDTFTDEGGYKEAKWDEPPKKLEDHIFIYTYDWRRDNVESARRLIQKISALKKASGQNQIKFDVVAHSMGGLIARYAAQYGSRDVSGRSQKPSWAGSAHINKIHLFGTPNHGAADSLQVLIEGYGAIKGINLPFVRDIGPLEVFTMPAIFQLLPHSDIQLFYDEDLKPMKVDLYDYRTWEKYGWSIYGDKAIFDRYSQSEVVRMEKYLEAALLRAKQFQAAIDAEFNGSVGLTVYGSACRDTPVAYVLKRDGNPGPWRLITKPEPFFNSAGTRVDISDVREIMMKPGDGRVAKSSLMSGVPQQSENYFECTKHNALLSAKTHQRRLLSSLVANPVASKR